MAICHSREKMQGRVLQRNNQPRNFRGEQSLISICLRHTGRQDWRRGEHGTSCSLLISLHNEAVQNVLRSFNAPLLLNNTCTHAGTHAHTHTHLLLFLHCSNLIWTIELIRDSVCIPDSQPTICSLPTTVTQD